MNFQGKFETKKWKFESFKKTWNQEVLQFEKIKIKQKNIQFVSLQNCIENKKVSKWRKQMLKEI